VNQLKGLKILELASVLAGPGVGQFFAELGADVIKVENMHGGGDVTRTWKTADEKTDDRSAYFCAVNWGKRSLAVDLSTPEGRSIVQRLARQSDIVIVSYKPGDAEKLGVDYQTLARDHEALIYGEITGYGADHPKVGYDAIIQAEAGFMSMNGDAGGPSLKMPVALIDVLAGHHLKEGLLLAMLEKTKTGKGQLVEVSLIQAAVASLVNQATNWLVGGKVPSKHGSSHPNIAPYGDVFLTADEKEFLLAVGTDAQFNALCQILGLDDIPRREEYARNEMRVRNRTFLNEKLRVAIAKWNSAELLASVNERKIPAGLIRSVKDVFETDEAKSLLLQSHGMTGVKSFISGINASEGSHFLPPPHLGEHTDEILKTSLNYSSETVKFLRANGIVA
jgi:crotonobetainyl-CoA:carnitine CoA-transferase CaiB-like acyl-CoA transferase